MKRYAVTIEEWPEYDGDPLTVGTVTIEAVRPDGTTETRRHNYGGNPYHPLSRLRLWSLGLAVHGAETVAAIADPPHTCGAHCQGHIMGPDLDAFYAILHA